MRTTRRHYKQQDYPDHPDQPYGFVGFFLSVTTKTTMTQFVFHCCYVKEYGATIKDEVLHMGMEDIFLFVKVFITFDFGICLLVVVVVFLKVVCLGVGGGRERGGDLKATGSWRAPA